ncbi:type II toxin-antitoxin system RelE/ParE family toxin [Pluralibacter gergoviae]
MDYRVEYSSAAADRLVALYEYIAQAAGPETARRFTHKLVDYCDSLAQFPHRGNCRDDILPGLRITNYRKRTVVAFVVRDKTVTIVGIWHGGQDYEAGLPEPTLY